MLNDPLREVTRKERRSLLGISAIALLIGWTQGRVLPSKVDSFGITDLTAPDRGVLLRLFLWIVGYYFVTFVVYAVTDFLKYFHTMAEGAKTLRKQRNEQIMGSLNLAAETPWWQRFVVPASLMRGVFDFFITLLASPCGPCGVPSITSRQLHDHSRQHHQHHQHQQRQRLLPPFLTAPHRVSRRFPIGDARVT